MAETCLLLLIVENINNYGVIINEFDFPLILRMDIPPGNHMSPGNHLQMQVSSLEDSTTNGRLLIATLIPRRYK